MWSAWSDFMKAIFSLHNEKKNSKDSSIERERGGEKKLPGDSPPSPSTQKCLDKEAKLLLALTRGHNAALDGH